MWQVGTVWCLPFLDVLSSVLLLWSMVHTIPTAGIYNTTYFIRKSDRIYAWQGVVMEAEEYGKNTLRIHILHLTSLGEWLQVSLHNLIANLGLSLGYLNSWHKHGLFPLL